MILQSTLPISTPKPNSISSSSLFSYPLSFPSGSCTFTPISKLKFSIKCSSKRHLQVHNYGTVDYEKKKRVHVPWYDVYKSINLMNPEMSVASVLNKCEKDGKMFTKWELTRIVRELRKYRYFHRALEVYEWMNNRMERFLLSSSDRAIQLDLIAKVRGVSSAEDYFTRIPNTLRDNRIYGSLLNAYVWAKVRDKAEALMERIRTKGYAIYPLPFNVMMGLYSKLGELDKVEELVLEMKRKRIQLDLYSYNIWLSAHGLLGSVEGMEEVFEEIKSDPKVNPNWTTFSSMASFYINFGELKKAEHCLKHFETVTIGRDRTAYHYLLSLYGKLGNKAEVYRVWSIYKLTFPKIMNWGYHAVITSLVRLGDIEGAEKIYEEWLQVKTHYDPKIGNLLMGWYADTQPFEKAKRFFDHITEAGGTPNMGSWEILGKGHMKEGRVSDALSCFKEAALIDSGKNWKPKPVIVSAFLELCEKKGEAGIRKEFVGLLRQLGCFHDKAYVSVLLAYGGIEVGDGDEQLVSHNRHNNDRTEETESEESETFSFLME